MTHECRTCTVHKADSGDCKDFRCRKPEHLRPQRMTIYGAVRHKGKGHDVRPVEVGK